MKSITISASFFFMTLAITLPFSLSSQAKSTSFTVAALAHLKSGHHATPRCTPFDEEEDGDPVDSCKKSCTIDSDCGLGGYCTTALVCEHKASYCLNDRWSVNARGETWNCDAYRCETTTGLCFRQANANEDCTAGYVFDGKGSCVPQVNCQETDPSCQDIFQRWLKARHDYETQTPRPTPTPFSCVACKAHEDCGSQQMCWQGRCEKSDLFCGLNPANDEQAVSNKTGVVANCGTYACDPIAKACFTQCQASADCQAGKACVAGVCQ